MDMTHSYLFVLRHVPRRLRAGKWERRERARFAWHFAQDQQITAPALS
jgi:hypothetical protein